MSSHHLKVFSSDSWFAKLRSNPESSLRLFCFPYAGGSATIYRDWPSGLKAPVELYSAQLPGRGIRMGELMFTRLSPMVDAISQAILPYLSKPFGFFGHSMGALIGFELARRLRKKYGIRPEFLLVSGRRAPQIPLTTPPTYNLPEAELIEELRRLSGTPKEVLDHPELLEIALPILRADFETVETYTYIPQPPLNCPIAVFGGLQDSGVAREALEPWREQTSSTFTLNMLPGDHFFLHSSLPLFLQMISEYLISIPDRQV
jgi:medium-chain acyl-[acyl-carrier-protein] hydrolase